MQPGFAIFIGIIVLAAVVWGVYWAVTKYRSSNNTSDASEDNGEDNNTTNSNTNKNNDNKGNNTNNGGDGNNGESGCPDVSDNVLPACEMERRREENGRTYCPRGVCGEGLEAVPDFKTAYMICVPKGKGVQEACP